ncbi:hypothetical protein Pla52n_67960 [Stieleria varia]|uniref:Uncharacterized protein n=1 Tax=Stieleria varia TaxID=2528005 RepID=A0A5C5ZRC4_9BACT|nr:hypothetical protein Pla52n_67960 [Stieleria varia]
MTLPNAVTRERPGIARTEPISFRETRDLTVSGLESNGFTLNFTQNTSTTRKRVNGGTVRRFTRLRVVLVKTRKMVEAIEVLSRTLLRCG